MSFFSALNRPALFEMAKSEKPDLIIIGGGITGAGIALDAALRGIKVFLIEKRDFASGTSSRSTKLIHGGLRYLKQLELGLVRQVGRERAVIHRNAPHLVIPEKMFLPVVKGGTLDQWSVALALFVYDRLAGVRKEERFRMLSAETAGKEEPMLRKDILNGAALYTEYRTDDARLTIEVIKSAVAMGASCINYAEADDFLYDAAGKMEGVMVRDHLSGTTHQIRAHMVVNAAGPWVDKVRGKDHEVKGKKLHLTKGIHLVVPYGGLPLRHSTYFDMPDGRMAFAIPRSGITYVGTTDTNYRGELEEPDVSASDIRYLLDGINRMFPNAGLRPADVISTWSGLRPLIHEEGKSPSELSRKDELFFSESGLISIAGGKLTGFRKMAKKVTDLVLKRMVRAGIKDRFVKCTTKEVQLTGSAFPSSKAVKAFIATLPERFPDLALAPRTAADLVHNFGMQSEPILEAATEKTASGTDPVTALVQAEAAFCLENEMVVSLADFLVRRTGGLFFHRPQLPAILPVVTDSFTAYFGWDEAERARQLADFDTLYRAALNFVKEEQPNS
jgi:glycerol-3-phosphate dehydrogenase